MKTLEEEAGLQADKANRLEVGLEDEFARSLWLGDFSLRMREISVIVTNYWLDDEFKNSLQRDEAVLQGRMEQFLAYLALEESLKPL